jgi:hypothetical protein
MSAVKLVASRQLSGFLIGPSQRDALLDRRKATVYPGRLAEAAVAHGGLSGGDSPDVAEEGPDVGDEEVGRFKCGEVAALVEV